MKPTHLLAPAAALVLGGVATAQASFTFQIDQPQSSFTWTATTSVGPVNGVPNNNFELQGVAVMELDGGGNRVGTAAFDGGDALVTPDLSGEIPNPLPFLPPLATIDITGLRLRADSDPFAVDAAGNFSTTVTIEMLAGTMMIDAGVLGSSTTDLTGNTSDPTAVSGTITLQGDTYHLDVPLVSNFMFSDAGTGIDATVTLTGAIVADHLCLDATPICENAQPNSTGLPSLCTVSGSTSVSNNDLVFTISQLPALNSALMIMSPDLVNVPLGNGILCMGNTTLGFVPRLPPGASNGAGVFMHALDITSPPAPGAEIDPGETWYFQCWHRDVSSPSPFFNFSTGVEVLFCP